MTASRQKTRPAAEPLLFEGDLNIYQAPYAKQWLMDALENHDELELDLSRVGEIDTAGFQLLILLKREANRQSKTVRLVAHSDSVLDLMNFYDMAAFFGDPVHIPAGQTPRS